MRLFAFALLVLLPCCFSVFAKADGDFREKLMEFLNKYKGATEGGADGKFKELFPKIEQDRKNTPGYTTCVTFQGLALGYASQKSGKKLSASPSVNFFNEQLRKKTKVPPSSFFATLPKGQTLDTVKDKSATYVDMSAAGSPRPVPGDLFLLAFSKTQSAKLQAGMFSHIGFVTAIKVRPDGKEEWTTVAGGGGSAKQKQEMIGEGVMVVDPKTALTGSVANQPGAERKLQGWVSLEALLNGAAPGTAATATPATPATPATGAGAGGANPKPKPKPKPNHQKPRHKRHHKSHRKPPHRAPDRR